jgi:hypothetical protein
MAMAPCFSAMNSMVMNNATPQQMDSDQGKMLIGNSSLANAQRVGDHKGDELSFIQTLG